ncbi:outer membrane protein assembly factor BamB [Candidatus Williamhamiltonella defendens]|uniref:outer membrane protein assembly factor BamB n=1 Tax=Candidatus Williamhamiltonella defendens TaxID=138072 RepID=UPI00130EF6A2|nr:outer membrane protein assembly factor BamB [Candidatus Hamiltonella defensa]
MQFYKIFWSGMTCLFLLNGCAIFNSEEDVVTLSPLPEIKNQFTLHPLWSTSVGRGIGEYYSRLRPVGNDKSLFVADRNGWVKSLNLETGKVIWQTNLSQKTGFISTKNDSAMLSGGLTVDGDLVYIGSEHAILFALNAYDGSVVWKTQVAGEVLSRPIISSYLILIHTGNGMIQAINKTNGSIYWTLNLDVPTLSLRGESDPAISSSGTAVFGGENGRVSAVTIDQGQLIWQQVISEVRGSTEIKRLKDVDMRPIIVDGIVYAAAYNGNFVALQLNSGEILWKRNLGSVNDLTIHAGYIYLVDQNDRLVALKSDTGIPVWKKSDLLHRGLTAPVIYNGYLVVGDSEGYLHWLNAEDGRFVTQQEVNRSGFLGAPIEISGKLIIQARNGTVYSFVQK